MSIHTIQVQLPQQSYPIYVGSHILEHPEYVTQHVHGSQVMIVSNTQVAPFYLEKVRVLFKSYQCDYFVMPDGETHKTWEQLTPLFTALIEKGHERSTTLVALGGGVVGDMTGFAAAVYMRGVNFIQIPTSLLAQVDASVGGKTAVNHFLGKNLLGAFYQPQCVVIDPLTLTTLPDRELRAGLAEVIKHALIADETFFAWLEKHMEDLLNRDMHALAFVIEQCCQIKAHIVAQDEREKNIRAWLNLGHTFAHAIEQLTHYAWLHGEAVAAGLVMAARLSQQLGFLNEAVVTRLQALIERAQLPVVLPSFSAAEYITAMQRDKKNTQGKLTFVLLNQIGSPFISHDVPIAAIHALFPL